MKFAVGYALFWVAAVIAVMWGWIDNIIFLASYDGPILTSGTMLLRIVGIFIPFLGAAMGFFG